MAGKHTHGCFQLGWAQPHHLPISERQEVLEKRLSPGKHGHSSKQIVKTKMMIIAFNRLQREKITRSINILT